MWVVGVGRLREFLKGAQSYFSKFSFLFHLKNHHSKDVNLEFQLKWSSRLDVHSSFVKFVYCSYLYFIYCVSLTMLVTIGPITIHKFIIIHSKLNTFQLLSIHGLREKYELIAQSPKL